MHKLLRSILIFTFIAMATAGLVVSIFLVWSTAFAVGWRGGDATLSQLAWKWKKFILISVYSAIAAIGLINHTKAGTIFAYAITITSILYISSDLLSFVWTGLESHHLVDLMLLIGWLVVMLLIFVGVSALRSLASSKTWEFVAIGVFTVLLLLSFYQ